MLEKDDYSIYNLLENLTFASKDNINGTFDIFDKKEYKKIIKDIAEKMVKIIERVDNNIKK